MSDKNLGNIENGKQFPQVNNFLRIIEELNLSLEDFGVIKQNSPNNPTQEELLKIIHTSTENQQKLYLEAIKFITKITN